MTTLPNGHKVIYAPARGRYLLQRRQAVPVSWIGRYETPWSSDSFFSDSEKAKERADDNANLFPDYDFRVIDTQPEG